MEKLERLLQLHFAALTAIGGILLSSGEVGIHLPITAVTAAILAYFLVDRWRLFSLPTIAAYIGMGGVAIFCMANFLWLRPNSQLMAVAQLLVYVEVVLLFQKKSIRIFEQIGVFCLLELIVAAVFNSALLFGVMLVPFALIGLRALVLLQALSTTLASEPRDNGIVKTSAAESMQNVARRSARLPRYGIAVLTPSVILVAMMFFYGLPRAGGSANASQIGGQVTTGFTDVLTLDQVGKLRDNQELVMRLTLSHLRTGTMYRVRQPIYLRGQALEVYDVNNGTGLWRAAPSRPRNLGSFLPDPYTPEDRTTMPDYDEVLAYAELQPLTSGALFAIAPYYTSHHEDTVEHVAGKWILRRRDEGGFLSRNRFTFRYATNAFRNGIQTPFIRYFAPGEGGYRDLYQSFARGQFSADALGFDPTLVKYMLQVDDQALPSVVNEAKLVVAEMGDRAQSKYQICRAIERHLSSSGRFKYSKDLTEARNRSIDPLEEFVAKYRTGHCQYFAAAMVMMLRSQGIPSRIVVGYRTDEYNSIGSHYLVRQAHAHAWVEAILDDTDLNEDTIIAGQPKTGPLLVRFDPTPGESTITSTNNTRVSHFYDFAQSIWNSYVLDMNSERQSETLFGRTDAVGVGNAYSRMLLQLQLYASQFNSAEFGPGALADPRRFSWRAGFLGIVATLILYGLYQMGVPQRLKQSWIRKQQAVSTENQSVVPFYQRLNVLLATRSIVRAEGQTPAEFVVAAAAELGSRSPSQFSNASINMNRSLIPLEAIVRLFYLVRFSGRPELTASEVASVEQSLNEVAALVQNAPDSIPGPVESRPR